MDLIDTYETTTLDRCIGDIITSYRYGEIAYPRWQRWDKWSDDYKHDFILSLLEGKDIPKLYACEDFENPNVSLILDGGHRERAITGYVDGEFPITLKDGDPYFFTELPEILQNRFLRRTQLQIVTYKDIDEIQARQIFNELNHQRPMSTDELINSHSSPLVDRIREFCTGDDNSMFKELDTHCSKINSENHKFYIPIVAMFSITERN